jgi:DNA-binding response OmpR family regulator
MQRKILLLEDDLQLSDTLKQFLEHHHFEVIVAYDSHRANDLIYEHHIDLMLLDIKVPFQNGFDLLQQLRTEGNTTPAIFITSLHSVEDVTRGFDVGCDDYIRKPFALAELLVRIEAQLKKQYGTRNAYVEISEGLHYNPKEFRLTKDGQAIPLKTKETKLLNLLLEHPNELLSYDQIFEALWEYDEEPSGGSLRTYVKTIRSLIGKEHIETVKNRGYRFVSK